MENINYNNFFNQYRNLEWDLFYYLKDNLHNENYNLLNQDLKNALTNNANGKYI
jgi:hypothetical protein